MDGSGAEVLLSGAEPHGIALDVPSNKMYWVEWASGKVRRANLDGSGAEDLVTDESSHPRGFALDVTGGKMYWTDDAPRIRSANLDGSDTQDLVTSGLDHPTEIALALGGGKMYWTNETTGKIQRSDLDVGVAFEPIALPPSEQVVGSEAGGVVGGPDDHEAAVGAQVVDARWRGSSRRPAARRWRAAAVHLAEQRRCRAPGRFEAETAGVLGFPHVCLPAPSLTRFRPDR